MEHYKLVFSKGDLMIEISSHEKEWVEKKEQHFKNIIDQIFNEGKKIEKNQNIKDQKNEIIINKSKIDYSSMPINEFYRKYLHAKVKSRSDIATFFVFYLSKVTRQQDIKSADIKDQFNKVQYPSWNKLNISDILNKAKKKAFLNNIGDIWSLTITGEDFVLNSLSENK